MLLADGLKVRRGNHVLSADLSFSIPGPGLYFLTGPNGSGKSTLLLQLAGLLPAEGIALNGRSLADTSLADRARTRVYLPQHPECPDELPALELAVLGRLPYLGSLEGFSKNDYALARQALQEVGFRKPVEQWMGTLSGGERQMVWLAQGLVQDGALWLLDEPTQHLDAARREHLFRLLQTLAEHHGKALLVATHELEALARLPQARFLDMLDTRAGFRPCTPEALAQTLQAHKAASGLFA